MRHFGLWLGLTVLVLLGVCCESGPVAPPAPPAGAAHGSISSTALCVRAIDGDTIELEDGTRVRLMGVDTPESVDPRKPVEHFGKEAAAYTASLVVGRRVTLVYDQNNAASQHRDRYGRLLAYVTLPDGSDLSRRIIAGGYGHAYPQYPCERIDDYLAQERLARTLRLGLWGSSTAPLDTGAVMPTVKPTAPSDDPEKTVPVRGYYRQDGTYVAPHYRRPPSKR